MQEEHGGYYEDEASEDSDNELYDTNENEANEIKVRDTSCSICCHVSANGAA
jgi:hypothetical protein